MSDKKEMFWLAGGVVAIDGKEYGAETPLPVDKIDKATLKKWKEKGKIGCKIEPVSINHAEIIKDLQAKVKDLEALVAENADVTKILEENEKLALDNEEKAALIDDLKAQLDSMKDGKK